MRNRYTAPNYEYHGIGFIGMLTILFIGLKLTGYVTWSWWLVLSPILIPIILVTLFLIISMIFIVMVGR